jgi:hypothetical protein
MIYRQHCDVLKMAGDTSLDFCCHSLLGKGQLRDTIYGGMHPRPRPWYRVDHDHRSLVDARESSFQG